MTVEEAVRTLGKCIQADPRYQQYQQAKQNNDADTALQEQIGAFNMKRMSYQRKMDEDPEENAEALQTLEKELDALYTEILKNLNMVAFQEAKDKMDSMTKQIDAIITLCLQGEDPDTCHPDLSQCSGDCSAWLPLIEVQDSWRYRKKNSLR